MAGRDALYLQPDMTDGQLLDAYRSRNRYYDMIAEALIDKVDMEAANNETWVDLLGRTGYTSTAILNFGANESILIEHRPAFASEVWSNENVSLLTPANLTGSVKALETIEKPVGAVVCCEQMSFLQQDFPAFARSLGILKDKNPDLVFGGTMGPSHHPFQTYRIADFRNGGMVRADEVMTELSHPIHQAVHREVVRIARERHGYTRTNAYPHSTPFTVPDVRSELTKAGFENLVIFESLLAVPGGTIYEYCQNAWTFYMRFAPLADLPTDAKIAILIEAIENVRAMSEYDEWCGIKAHHPVAYYIAW